MKVCEKCGKQLPNEAKFCDKCGAMIQPQKQPNTNVSKAPKSGKKIAIITSVALCIAAIVAGLLFFILSGEKDFTKENHSRKYYAQAEEILKELDLAESPEKYCIYDDSKECLLFYIHDDSFYKHDLQSGKQKEIYLGELGNTPREIVIEKDNPKRVTDENFVVLAYGWGKQESAISYNPINDMNNEFVVARFVDNYNNIINAPHRILVQWNTCEADSDWRFEEEYYTLDGGRIPPHLYRGELIDTTDKNQQVKVNIDFEIYQSRDGVVCNYTLPDYDDKKYTMAGNITSNNKIKLQRTLDESEIEEIVGTFDNKELSGVYRLIIDGEIEIEYKVIATKVY